MKRRSFLKTASLAAAATAVHSVSRAAGKLSERSPAAQSPLIVNTWDYGRVVPETAYKTIVEGGTVVEAVEKAVRIPEADPEVTSVGRGGFPDRDGNVTLDASIMDGNGNCGSVVFLEHILHPVSVARLVMEKTPHVLLAGDGALRFAQEHGFKKETLLTPNAKREYEKWLKTTKYKRTPIGKGNHDTIGLLAMDEKGAMAGACTTSGLAWKIRGRVGDSPLIGAGLYVDNEVGAATATGLGEAVIKICGSFLIVELMRQGKSPQEACQVALERIINKQPQYKKVDGFFIGFCAFNKNGDIGGFSYGQGFEYSVMRDGAFSVVKADSMIK